MTDVCTAALLPIKPSSDDDSGFRHGTYAYICICVCVCACREEEVS